MGNVSLSRRHTFRFLVTLHYEVSLLPLLLIVLRDTTSRREETEGTSKSFDRLKSSSLQTVIRVDKRHDPTVSFSCHPCSHGNKQERGPVLSEKINRGVVTVEEGGLVRDMITGQQYLQSRWKLPPERLQGEPEVRQELRSRRGSRRRLSGLVGRQVDRSIGGEGNGLVSGQRGVRLLSKFNGRPMENSTQARRTLQTFCNISSLD